MATTYQAIASQVLSSTAASVTLSSIPNTYTDLVLKISSRTNQAGLYDTISYTVNGNTGNIYSYTLLRGNGSAASSTNLTASQPGFMQLGADGNNATASTFGIAELYIPNYTASTNKQFAYTGASETNAATGVWVATGGMLTQTTAAISSITLSMLLGTAFLAGSRFDLYGLLHA